MTDRWRLDSVRSASDADVRTKTWTRFEYDRLVEAEILGPEDRIELLAGAMVVKEPQYSPHATAARIADYWIVNIPDRRLEVYRDPAPDAAAPFGWRYGRVVTLGPDERVAPLAVPSAFVTVADLLP